MCSGAMVWSQSGRMVYCLSHDELAEIAGFNIMLCSGEIFAKSPFKPEVTHGVLKEKTMLIIHNIFNQRLNIKRRPIMKISVKLTNKITSHDDMISR